MYLLISTPCARGAAAAVRRGWREPRKAPIRSWELYARVAVFVDLDEDRTLDAPANLVPSFEHTVRVLRSRPDKQLENLFAGVTSGRVAALEMVILISKLVANPGVEPDEWHKKLYLHPGQWILWAGVTVLGTMVVLSGIRACLHLNEKVRLLRSLWIISCVAHLSPFFSCSWDLQ